MEAKKKEFKKFIGKKEEPTATGSTLNGVQRLELNELHLFPIIKSQLHDLLTGEFGKQADFVIGNPPSSWTNQICLLLEESSRG